MKVEFKTEKYRYAQLDMKCHFISLREIKFDFRPKQKDNVKPRRVNFPSDITLLGKKVKSNKLGKYCINFGQKSVLNDLEFLDFLRFDQGPIFEFVASTFEVNYERDDENVILKSARDL